MTCGKIFRRALFATFGVIFLLNAAVVGAKIQMYTASGEDYPSEVESMDISKQRALEKAVKKAKKEAGVYLKTYSRTVNAKLTDDDIIAITSNSYKIIGEPKFTREIVKHSDETSIIVWKVNVDVQVDDSEIQSWIKRDDKNKSTIISQTREANKASDENERKIEDLRAKYNRATSQAEKDSLRKQMNDADKRFLATQKVEEGLKLKYKSIHKEEELACYSKAIELDPKYAEAYFYRGICYIRYSFSFTGPSADAKENSALAIADFSKAIELNPDYIEAYYERAGIYKLSDNYEQAIADYSKIIEVKPDDYESYENRGDIYYYDLNDYQRAIADYSKVIELEPLRYNGYWKRAWVYESMENYEAAVADYSKALEVNPDSTVIYNNRGELYFKLKDYSRAIADFTKAIEFKLGVSYLKDTDSKTWSDMDKGSICRVYEKRAKSYENLGDYDKAITDYSKIIEIAPGNGVGGWSERNYAAVHYYRGICYQAIGDEAKAQEDFAKAKELGYNG